MQWTNSCGSQRVQKVGRILACNVHPNDSLDIYHTHMNYLPKLETCTFSEIVSACKERFGVRDGHHTK